MRISDWSSDVCSSDLVHQRTRGIIMPVTTVPGNTLITATPEEGRQLAIKMARLVIKATQPDDAVRDKLRPSYANDAALLLQIAKAVATEFATIAAAHHYWRTQQARRPTPTSAQKQARPTPRTQQHAE